VPFKWSTSKMWWTSSVTSSVCVCFLSHVNWSSSLHTVTSSTWVILFDHMWLICCKTAFGGSFKKTAHCFSCASMHLTASKTKFKSKNTIGLHASKVQKILSFSHHLISQRVWDGLFEDSVSLNTSFPKANSALIGQTAQSVVIGQKRNGHLNFSSRGFLNSQWLYTL